uniref:Uncharacterized protein n=1 Tax=Rhizophora mucronata TaxID=61149 RepID=A0A2P2NHL4_RHIMU
MNFMNPHFYGNCYMMQKGKGKRCLIDSEVSLVISSLS